MWIRRFSTILLTNRCALVQGNAIINHLGNILKMKLLPTRLYYTLLFLCFSFVGFCQHSVAKRTGDTHEAKAALQEYIVKAINEHGFEEDTFDHRYRASFEGDHLRLVLLKKGGQAIDNGQLYDFSNVYKFQKVSRRDETLAFITIYVAAAKQHRKEKYDRLKLAMRFDSATDADLLVNALKAYGALLIK